MKILPVLHKMIFYTQIKAAKMRCLLLILKHHTIIIVIIIVIVQCNSSCKAIRFITWVHQVVVRDDAVQSASTRCRYTSTKTARAARLCDDCNQDFSVVYKQA